MKNLTEEWLKAAQDDLRVIDLIGHDEHLTHMIAFHAQQAVEKSLKAAIEEYGLGSIKVHSLERLFEIVKPYVRIEIDLLIVDMLDKLYVDARYPGNLGLMPNGMPSLARAEKFTAFAHAVHKIIESALSGKVTR
jgi:HEPN domain-containing protein